MSGAAPHTEDLEPEQTEGFKVGEKKTIDEYQQLGTSSLFPLPLHHSPFSSK